MKCAEAGEGAHCAHFGRVPSSSVREIGHMVKQKNGHWAGTLSQEQRELQQKHLNCLCLSSYAKWHFVYFVYNFSKTHIGSNGVACRIFKWISPFEDQKYLSKNISL